MCRILLICSSVGRNLGGFHILAVLNNAAVNMSSTGRIHAFNSFQYMPRIGTGRSSGNLFLIFWGTTVLFPIVGVPFYILTSIAQETNFSTSSSALVIVWVLFCLIVAYLINGCEVISQYSFDLHFLNGELCLVSFHVLIDHLCVFLVDVSVQVLFSSFLNSGLWVCF